MLQVMKTSYDLKTKF